MPPWLPISSSGTAPDTALRGRPGLAEFHSRRSAQTTMRGLEITASMRPTFLVYYLQTGSFHPDRRRCRTLPRLFFIASAWLGARSRNDKILCGIHTLVLACDGGRRPA